MKTKISALIMDIDGTLTDGKIHISQDGELFKSFYVKDGYAIRHILPQYGILPIIITGRSSSIVDYRAKELNICQCYQNISDKGMCLQNICKKLKIPLQEIACIGDDLNDLPMMKMCSMTGCPADASFEVKIICDYVCAASGGYGAVREFIEWIIQS